MEGLIKLLAFGYVLVAAFFTIAFELTILREEGFLTWLICGSWLAPILGMLWPFTHGLLS